MATTKTPATPPLSSDEVGEAVQVALDRKRLKDLEEQVDSLLKDRDQALRWGVITLGAAVVALITWIFNLITGK
jgi:hypothetical protein